jgi:hypothetical protein
MNLDYAWCFQWNKWLLLVLVVTDVLIWLSYLAIPFVIYKYRKTIDIPHWVAWAFIAFIVACGFGHFCDTLNRFWPLYWYKALSSVFTAAASVGTVVGLYLHNEWLHRPTRAQLETWLAELRKAQTELTHSPPSSLEATLAGIIARLDEYDQVIQRATALQKEV